MPQTTGIDRGNNTLKKENSRVIYSGLFELLRKYPGWGNELTPIFRTHLKKSGSQFFMKRTGRSTGRPKGSTNHDPKIKEVMSELFQQGFRRDYVARVTGMSDGYVKNWWTIYLAHGKEALLKPMKQHKYSYETRLAAAKAVVDDEQDVVSVMRAYNIFSPSPLRQWCVLYREGGPEALIQKKRGHPKGYKAKKEPLTREQKLEAMVRRLQIEIAVLKKAKALKASRSLKTEIKRQ